jgi:serine O-acetyltransferase
MLNAIFFYRIARWMYLHHIPFLPKLIYYLQYLLFNCSVPASCTIGLGTKFGYGGMAVILHARTKIGRNCIIGSCVTIGGKSGWYEVPEIGDNVEIHSGAKIVGPVRIGNNVIVGANAVVTKDIPDNCVVAGIPAKIIKENISKEDFKSIKYRGESDFPVTPKLS